MGRTRRLKRLENGDGTGFGRYQLGVRIELQNQLQGGVSVNVSSLFVKNRVTQSIDKKVFIMMLRVQTNDQRRLSIFVNDFLFVSLFESVLKIAPHFRVF